MLKCLGEESVFDLRRAFLMLPILKRWACEASLEAAVCCLSRSHCVCCKVVSLQFEFSQGWSPLLSSRMRNGTVVGACTCYLWRHHLMHVGMDPCLHLSLFGHFFRFQCTGLLQGDAGAQPVQRAIIIIAFLCAAFVPHCDVSYACSCVLCPC